MPLSKLLTVDDPDASPKESEVPAQKQMHMMQQTDIMDIDAW